jgi:hypothetical protein
LLLLPKYVSIYLLFGFHLICHKLHRIRPLLFGQKIPSHRLGSKPR